ncbi:MAG: GrpB family protein [Deinococcales bacterium]|jgi:GrpB-like predicted nucleotidyltransferase (UPF0157 family)
MPRATVTLVPYDPGWAERFATEATRLLETFGAEVAGLHHIGSTAVPALTAKPTIDVLLEVRDLSRFGRLRTAAERGGYAWHGEFGIAGRRYLVRAGDADGEDAVHVHAFLAGDAQVARHLAFRDYLLAHPDRAAAYGSLKAKLAAAHGDNREAYVAGKSGFIRETDALARAWRRS